MITSCHICGLVVDAEEHADHKLKCPRCSAVLLKSRDEVRNTLILSITAMILMIPSSIFPFLKVQINEVLTTANLLQTADVMAQDGYALAGAVIFITALVFPLLYLSLMIYVSAGCLMSKRLPMIWTALRLLGFCQHFQMTDVFIVGILVSVVKLLDISDVSLGTGFYFLALTSVLIISIDLYYDKRLFWCRRGYA